MEGAGKYDDLCTAVRLAAKAQVAVVIICDGEKGHGFSVQGPVTVHKWLPKALRYMADHLENANQDADPNQN